MSAGFDTYSNKVRPLCDVAFEQPSTVVFATTAPRSRFNPGIHQIFHEIKQQQIVTRQPAECDYTMSC